MAGEGGGGEQYTSDREVAEALEHLGIKAVLYVTLTLDPLFINADTKK